MHTWDRIARTGSFIAMSGQPVTITTSMLDELVNTFDPSDYIPPLVKGHPAVEDPAYGHVNALRREGEFLLAQYAQVPDSVREDVNTGRYLSKSIAIFPGRPWRLKHVGLLGAAPPAMKGLGPIQLTQAAEHDVLCFANLDDTQLTQKEPTMDPKERLAELEKQLAAEKEAREAAEKAGHEAEAAKKAAEEQLTKTAQETAAKERETKVDQLIEQGKVLPAEKEQIKAFAAKLHDGEELCFTEGEGKKPLLEHFWSFLESRKQHDLFAFASPDAATATSTGAADNSDFTGLAGKF